MTGRHTGSYTAYRPTCTGLGWGGGWTGLNNTLKSIIRNNPRVKANFIERELHLLVGNGREGRTWGGVREKVKRMGGGGGTHCLSCISLSVISRSFI